MPGWCPPDSRFATVIPLISQGQMPAPRHHSRSKPTTPRDRLWHAPLRVELHTSDETIEIFIEADFETLPEERRRFALLNVPATSSAKLPQQPRAGPRPPVLESDMVSDLPNQKRPGNSGAFRDTE